MAMTAAQKLYLSKYVEAQKSGELKDLSTEEKGKHVSEKVVKETPHYTLVKTGYVTSLPIEQQKSIASEKMQQAGYETYTTTEGKEVYIDTKKSMKDIVETGTIKQLPVETQREIADRKMEESGYVKLPTTEGKEVYIKTEGVTPSKLSQDIGFKQLPVATQRELMDKAMYTSGYYVNPPETGLPRYEKMSPETSLYGMHKSGTLQAMPVEQQKKIVSSRMLQVGYDVETVDGREVYVANPEKQAKHEAAYWQGRPQAQRLLIVSGRSMVWTGTQPIAFGEFLVEDVGGRVVTGKSVNVFPFREEFSKWTSGYATPGLEEAAFGSISGDNSAWVKIRRNPLEAIFATGGEIFGEVGTVAAGYTLKGAGNVGVTKLRAGLAKHNISLPRMPNLSPSNIWERIKLKAGKTKEISEDVLHQPGYDIGHTPGGTPAKRISYVVEAHKGTKYIDDISEINPRKGYVTGHGTGFKPASNIVLERDELTGKLAMREVKAWDIVQAGTRKESPGISTAPIGEVSRHWYRGADEFGSLKDYFNKSDISLLPKVKRRPELATFESTVPAKKVSSFNVRNAAELKPFAKDVVEETGYRNPFYQRTGEYIRKNVDVGEPVVAPKMYAGGIEQEIIYKEATKTVPIKTKKPLVTVLKGEGRGTVVRVNPRAVVEAGETPVGVASKLKTIGEVAEEMKPSPLKKLLSYSEGSSKPTAVLSPSKLGSKAVSIISSKGSSKVSSPVKSSPLSSLKSKISSKGSSAASSIRSALSSPKSSKTSSKASSAVSSPASAASSGSSAASSGSSILSSSKKKKYLLWTDDVLPEKKLDKIKFKNPLSVGARERGHPVKLLDVKKTFSINKKGGMKII